MKKRNGIVITVPERKILMKMRQGYTLKSLKMGKKEFTNIEWTGLGFHLDLDTFMSLRSKNLVTDDPQGMSRSDNLRYHRITKKAKDLLTPKDE